MKIAFTICSANYLPFAKSLADSLVEYNESYQFIIALADTYKEYDHSFFEPHTIMPVSAMGIADLREMNERYDIFELSCALKPYVATYLLETYTNTQTIVYFDSDILVFDSLTELESILVNHPLVLTPHISTMSIHQNVVATELGVLRTGLYNAGFFGMNGSNEGVQFLTWWKARLKDYCFNDAKNGLFVDQLWLNLAPVYFQNTYLLRHPGYNVAYWNFSERKLTADNQRLMVNQYFPLVFYHFSGYDIHHPDIISKHNPQALLKHTPLLLPLFKKYKELALKNNKPDFFSLPATMGKSLLIEEEPKKSKKNYFIRKIRKIFKLQK